MTLLEILKNNGLTDEVINKVVADMKANKVFTASEENLDVRYNKLKLENDGKEAELAKANALITELQKGNKGNEELTAKIKTYEADIEKLKQDNEKIRIDAQLDRELIEAHVADVDYVKFKLKEKHPDGFKLDEQGHITGLNDSLDALKIQIPSQFKSTDKKIEEKKLEDNDPNNQGLTKKDILKMSYQERAGLIESNPDAYHEAMNK